ncbi:zinc finger protein kipf-like [Drosophila tropicalis]|uniref:zinc finger protein kipf-like n=1 Tax=Drosophila tropicalis TaxID=46794 RepID=UPI0035ABA664
MSMLEMCRLCMDRNMKLMDIFNDPNEEHKDQKQEPSLVEMLNECTNCHVQRDALPQRICCACILALQNAFHFKQKCEQSYRQLLQLLKSKENEQLQQDNIDDDDDDHQEELINYDQESQLELENDCLAEGERRIRFHQRVKT